MGKIYNFLSHRLARKVYEQVDGLKEVYVILLSRIGSPVDEPVLMAAQLVLADGCALEEVRREVEAVFEDEFAP